MKTKPSMGDKVPNKDRLRIEELEEKNQLLVGEVDGLRRSLQDITKEHIEMRDLLKQAELKYLGTIEALKERLR